MSSASLILTDRSLALSEPRAVGARGSTKVLAACPRHVRLGGNLGSAGCPVLPVPHHLLSNVRHDVAIVGTIKLLHGPPVLPGQSSLIGAARSMSAMPR